MKMNDLKINVLIKTTLILTFLILGTSIAQSSGKVNVKITGKDINLSGEYDCNICGDYFYPLEKKGVLFEAKIEGWKLQVANGEERIAGSQVRKNSEVTVLLNGPGKYYGYDNRKAEGKIEFDENFKTAVLKVTLKNVIDHKNTIEVEATFNCK